MGFFEEFDPAQALSLAEISRNSTRADVGRVLSKSGLKSIEDFAVLISPAADFYLEDMAQRSSLITERNFGKTIRMFVPLYVSNVCVNNCRYCGFAKRNNIERKTLTLEEVRAEVDATYKMGFRSILLVAGESPKLVNLGYMDECIKIAAKRFPSISVEIAPSPVSVYKSFVKNGCEGLTVFQETFDSEVYKYMHPSGPKSNFKWRLGTPERALEAGMRVAGLGALFGLNDWRYEIISCAIHAKYLYRNFYRARIGISLPRMRPAASGFQPKPEFVPTDRELVKIICALRIVFEHLAITVSTREPRYLRDGLVGLGVTQMSAASSTRPGGYAEHETAEGQFDIDDDRSVEEFANMIASKGYEPVWKDFDLGFIEQQS